MLLEELAAKHERNPIPFIVSSTESLTFTDVLAASEIDLSQVRSGDVVALVGDFSPSVINALLRLIDRKAIIVPLSPDTRASFPYFFESAGVDVSIEDGVARRIRDVHLDHPMLDELRCGGSSGLVLFSSGTTGKPKAILHNLDSFLVRFRTPRPALKTLNFLLFDHIGGINTLLHTIFNCGTVVIPSARQPEQVANDLERHQVELLPTTPTFLRMLLFSGLIESRREAFASLRVVTYGTEAMDQNTLDRLCAALPHVDFRQTYGMSELGILRIKSRARDSLYLTVGGEGIETHIDDRGVLLIRARFRMLGYLNAPQPFRDGWYYTGDIVESDGSWIRIIGRSNQIINVGGIKILPTEVERIALLHPDVVRCSARSAPNPITGQHVEVVCEPRAGIDLNRAALKFHFAAHMQESVRPHRIRIGAVDYNHRFKKA
jgi:acyl-coenzyme A synthetase/AMP-(fatty) acid ligase